MTYSTQTPEWFSTFPKTEQELFDKVAAHLLTQKVASKNGSLCFYRGENGIKCAAGCLIPDEDYDADMEDQSWQELVKLGLVPSEFCSLVTELQFIHDDYPAEHWGVKLISLAQESDLQWKFGDPANPSIPSELKL